MSRHRTILSIDGGGIRGIIPAMMLHYIETATGRPAADLFDLMVGTSTGGILALGLAQPDPERPQRSRYRARDLADLYAQRGPGIFSSSPWRRIRSMAGLFDESYPSAPLEATLQDYFGDSSLAGCRCPTIVTAYDIEASETVFLKSFKPEHQPLACTAAARATSAAPTFFEPLAVSVAGDTRALIDGGVFINSPVVSAYAEGLKLFPGDTLTVLSLGTGELTRSIPARRAARWGKLGWFMPVLDCVFDGVSRAADYQMNLFLGQRYQRFQLTLDQASPALDDTSPGNIAALFQAAADMIERERSRLDNLVAYLRALHGHPPLLQGLLDDS